MAALKVEEVFQTVRMVDARGEYELRLCRVQEELYRGLGKGAGWVTHHSVLSFRPGVDTPVWEGGRSATARECEVRLQLAVERHIRDGARKVDAQN